MELNRQTIKHKMTISKIKLALCILGVIICMSILAAAPPLTENSAVGINVAAKAKALKPASLPNINTKGNVFQTASSPGQGSDSAVQGSAAQAPPADPQSTAPVPVYTPPAQLVNYPCSVCGGPHMMCPETMSGCDRCGGPGEYACLIE